jgi:para-nitrobenzyl esterase
MRIAAVAALLMLSAAPTAVVAQAAPAAAPAAAAGHYSVEDTDIGTLLDDPAAKAILDKHIAGFSAQPQIDMARSMTLKSVQQYSPDTLSDKVLADIQADLNTLPVRK